MLDDFAVWWARSAVATQEGFDDAAAADAETVRMRISTIVMRSELRVAISESQSFAIQVAPINLGYRIARRYTAAADMTVSITVEQVPSQPYRR